MDILIQILYGTMAYFLGYLTGEYLEKRKHGR